VRYGDTEKKADTDENGRAEVDFIAQQGVTSISAEFRGDGQTSSAKAVPTSVYVSDKGWGDLTTFIIIILVVIGLVQLYKRYGEVILR
jgi:hypothetical protein